MLCISQSRPVSSSSSTTTSVSSPDRENNSRCFRSPRFMRITRTSRTKRMSRLSWSTRTTRTTRTPWSLSTPTIYRGNPDVLRTRLFFMSVVLSILLCFLYRTFQEFSFHPVDNSMNKSSFQLIMLEISTVLKIDRSTPPGCIKNS